MQSSQSEIEYVIEAKQPWFTFNWSELFEHRDLLLILVRKDVVAKYKQTVLGPLWHVIQPLLMASVFAGVFSRVAAINTEGVPRILFYLAGLFGWNYFANTLTTTAGTFAGNSALFGKVYFPRLVMPFAAALSNLFSMAIQLSVFFLFFIGYSLFGAAGNAEFGLRLLLLPGVVVLTALLSLGCGLCVASLTIRYRDLQHALPFVMTLWMFATPVIYPVSQVSALSQWVFWLNPMAPLIEAYRHILLGIGSVPYSALVLSVSLSFIIFVLGITLFQRAERTAVDTI